MHTPRIRGTNRTRPRADDRINPNLHKRRLDPQCIDLNLLRCRQQCFDPHTQLQSVERAERNDFSFEGVSELCLHRICGRTSLLAHRLHAQVHPDRMPIPIQAHRQEISRRKLTEQRAGHGYGIYTPNGGPARTAAFVLNVGSLVPEPVSLGLLALAGLALARRARNNVCWTLMDRDDRSRS